MKIAEIMTGSVVTLSPDQKLREAIQLFRTRRIRHLPVVDAESRLVGIVTDRDVKQATPSLHSGVDQDGYERILDETRIDQVMTREPTTISPDAPLKAAARIFIGDKVGALPVVEDGRLVGIVTSIDLLRVLHNMLPD